MQHLLLGSSVQQSGAGSARGDSSHFAGLSHSAGAYKNSIDRIQQPG